MMIPMMTTVVMKRLIMSAINMDSSMCSCVVIYV